MATANRTTSHSTSRKTSRSTLVKQTVKQETKTGRTAVPEAKFISTPRPFSDNERMLELLEMLISGLPFLYTILRENEDDTATERMVTGELESAAEELDGMLDKNVPILNRDHPRFEQFCAAMNAIDKESWPAREAA